MLLQPLLTLSLSWLAGGTETLALGTHTSAVMLPPASTPPAHHRQKGTRLVTEEAEAVIWKK